MRHRGCAGEQLDVGLVGFLPLEPLAADLRGPVRLTGRGGQLGQAVEGPDIAGVEIVEMLPGGLFRCAVALLLREPGAERPEQGLRVRFGRDVLEALPGDVGPPGRHGPLEPGAPRRRVFGPALEATGQPAVGFGELAQPGRQMSPCQPDPIVIGSLAAGALHRLPDSFGREGSWSSW